MAKRKYSEVEMIGALKQMEVEHAAAEVGRELGVSKQTIYEWGRTGEAFACQARRGLNTIAGYFCDLALLTSPESFRGPAYGRQAKALTCKA